AARRAPCGTVCLWAPAAPGAGQAPSPRTGAACQYSGRRAQSSGEKAWQHRIHGLVAGVWVARGVRVPPRNALLTDLIRPATYRASLAATLLLGPADPDSGSPFVPPREDPSGAPPGPGPHESLGLNFHPARRTIVARDLGALRRDRARILSRQL